MKKIRKYLGIISEQMFLDAVKNGNADDAVIVCEYLRKTHNPDPEIIREAVYQLINFADHANPAIIHALYQHHASRLLGYSFLCRVATGRDSNSDKVRERSDIVEVLLNEMVILHAEDLEGRKTPLHIAASKGFDTVVHLLVKAGVNVDPEDTWGATPVCYAVLKGRLSTVNYFINEAHADTAIKDKHRKSLLHYWAQGNHADKSGFASILQLLLDSSARQYINKPDKKGRTPLILYVSHTNDTCHCIPVLRKAGAIIDYTALLTFLTEKSMTHPHESSAFKLMLEGAKLLTINEGYLDDDSKEQADEAISIAPEVSLTNSDLSIFSPQSSSITSSTRIRKSGLTIRREATF